MISHDPQDVQRKNNGNFFNVKVTIHNFPPFFPMFLLLKAAAYITFLVVPFFIARLTNPLRPLLRVVEVDVSISFFEDRETALIYEECIYRNPRYPVIPPEV